MTQDANGLQALLGFEPSRRRVGDVYAYLLLYGEVALLLIEYHLLRITYAKVANKWMLSFPPQVEFCSASSSWHFPLWVVEQVGLSLPTLVGVRDISISLIEAILLISVLGCRYSIFFKSRFIEILRSIHAPTRQTVFFPVALLCLALICQFVFAITVLDDFPSHSFFCRSGASANNIAILRLWVVLPLLEEFVFRCLLGRICMNRSNSVHVACWVPAALFSAVHLKNALAGDMTVAYLGLQMLQAFWFGAFASACYLRTGSSIPGFTVHVLNNILASFTPKQLVLSPSVLAAVLAVTVAYAIAALFVINSIHPRPKDS